MNKLTAKITVCGLAIGLLAGVSASAATITFDLVPSSGNPILTTLTTDGFTVTSGHFHTVDSPGIISFGGAVNNGTIYIGEEAGSLGLPMTLVQALGGQFALTSIDGAKLFLGNAAAASGGFPNADTLNILGNLNGGGTVSASFSLANAFQTFFLPGTFANLDSVVFSGSLFTGAPGGIALDNIVVNGGGGRTPDAGSTLALLSGAMMGLRLLRKK